MLYKALSSHIAAISTRFSTKLSTYSLPSNFLTNTWTQKPVGKGASCVVYKGFAKALDTMVAIKVVSLQKLNPKSNEEMRREIELLNSLKDEDCIINLYDHEVKSLITSLASLK